MDSLQIPGDIFDQMVEQARAEAPIEACGILAGNNGRVEKIYKMKNADKSSNHFMMAPEEQFKVVKDIRACGLKMLAIYHSHPVTPARPSAEDIRLSLTPDLVYVIVSLKNKNMPAIKGFLIEDSSVTDATVEVIDG